MDIQPILELIGINGLKYNLIPALAKSDEIEKSILPDVANYIKGKPDQKFVVIGTYSETLQKLLKIEEISTDTAIKNFTEGKSNLLITSLYHGYDVGDKIGDDPRELIILPSYFSGSINQILARVWGRINNKSDPIVTLFVPVISRKL